MRRHHAIKLHLLFLILGLLCGNGFTDDQFSSITQKPFDKLITFLSNSEEKDINEILDQWQTYLKRVSTYSHDSYIEAIKLLQKDYSYSLVEIEKCSDDRKELRNNSDSVWIDELISNFGLGFVQENKKGITLYINSVVAGSQENCCKPFLEDAFFKEAILYGAYKYYCNTFIDFIESQSAAIQKKINSRKKAAEEFIALLNKTSIMRVYIGRGLPRKVLSEIEVKQNNPVLFDYFKKHPLSCDIDAFKAIEIFKKEIGLNQ